ncbi:MAG: pyridoxal phosphate-dependent aminotransferase [Alphaproteobacteria bacterium]
MNEPRKRRDQAGADSGERYIRRQIAELPPHLIRDVAHIGMKMPNAIALWFGEPDQPTPKFICDAAAKALAEGKTFYTPNAGVSELREALAAYGSELYRVPIGVDRITVLCSGVNAIMLSMQILLDAGDNIVCPSPLWPNIEGAASVMGAAVRSVPLDFDGQRWRLDLERLEDAVDDRTRAVLVNSPNNPSGWVMSAEQQKALLDWCRSRGLWVVADEVYARIIYDRRVAPSFLEHAEPDDRLIVVNSFSKPWAMTGWRLGWITAPPRLGPTLEIMNEYNVAGAATFAQWAGIVALKDGEAFIADSVERYRRARDLVYQRLTGHPRIRFARPEAAFYAFFSVDGVRDSLGFAKDLLKHTGVGLSPGTAFGSEWEGFFRLCYAVKPETLTTAMDRLLDFIGRRAAKSGKARG